uniref:Uncharacterized protein n=1 Tax=Arundo donax TaxID=35708 RepID=A0A0A8XSV1_ARUDO
MLDDVTASFPFAHTQTLPRTQASQLLLLCKPQWNKTLTSPLSQMILFLRSPGLVQCTLRSPGLQPEYC